MRRTAVLFVFTLIMSAAAGAQWPQWRGPNRDAVLPADAVPVDWPEKLAVKWRHAVGEGYSSPVVEGGRLFVHSRRDPQELVTAIDLASGKPAWTDGYAAPFSKNPYAKDMAKGPFSTPLAGGGRLFTLGATGILSAYDAGSGRLLWRRDWSKEVDTSKLFTGTAMSPLLHDGALVVHVGDDGGGTFRALDPTSGKERWSLPGDGPGYASPIAATFDGVPQLVTMTDRAVVGLEPAAGRLLWRVPFPDQWNENIVTPVVAGKVLVVSGTRSGTFGLRVAKAGDGWSATRLWHNGDLPMYMSSPVVDGTLVYGLSSRRKGQFFCLDATTGTARWTTEGRAAANASLVSAGVNLVALTSEGELLVVRRSPERFEELRRYKVAETPTWAHPVVIRTGVVIRDAGSIALWSF